MLDTVSTVIMSIGSAMSIFVILLLIVGIKKDNFIEPLNNKEFTLYQLYGIGFVMLDITKHDYTSKGERKRKQEIALMYGEKHAEYYLRVNAAERWTLALLIGLLGFIMYGFTKEIAVVLIMLVFAATAYYYVSTLPNVRLNKKSNKILNDFAEVASKLALLVNAGMIMREAWERIAYTGESELYKEMRLVVDNMKNGMSEIDAYTTFGIRCTSPEVKKFISTVIQGIAKGNKELVEMIKQQSREIWLVRKHKVKQQGEKASSKLLIPISIMFIGVLIMIVLPIFANLGV